MNLFPFLMFSVTRKTFSKMIRNVKYSKVLNWSKWFFKESSLICLKLSDIWAVSWQNQQNDCAPSEDSDQPGHPPWVWSESLLCSQWVSFFMRTAKTLIRLGRCPDWSESSLSAHAILLVLSCSGSYCDYFKSLEASVWNNFNTTPFLRIN